MFAGAVIGVFMIALLIAGRDEVEDGQYVITRGTEQTKSENYRKERPSGTDASAD